MEEDEINKWVKKLRDSKLPIIVEGQNDKKTLEHLGIKSEIFTLKKPLFSLIEEIAARHKKVVILTDFDKKGKELYGRLRSGLQRLGVRIDTHFREFLQKNTKLSHIEGLYTYLSKKSGVCI